MAAPPGVRAQIERRTKLDLAATCEAGDSGKFTVSQLALTISPSEVFQFRARNARYFVPGQPHSCDLVARSRSRGDIYCGTGWFQPTPDDCLRPAAATYLQVPIENIPELEEGSQHLVLDAFLAGHGLVPSPILAYDPPPEFWIADAVRRPEALAVIHHALVMFGDLIAFDPWVDHPDYNPDPPAYALLAGKRYIKKGN